MKLKNVGVKTWQMLVEQTGKTLSVMLALQVKPFEEAEALKVWDVMFTAGYGQFLEAILVVKSIKTLIPGSVWLHFISAFGPFAVPEKFATRTLVNGPISEEGLAESLHCCGGV